MFDWIHLAIGKVKEWSYDDRNVVTTVTYDGDTVLSKSTDAGYRCTSETFGNDLVRSISFGRQDNLRTKDKVIGIGELNFDYSYAADKNVKSETILSGMFADLGFNVTYDDGNRITIWNRVADYLDARETLSWNFDDAGNWNAITIDGDVQNRSNNTSDELTTISGNTLSYDSRGNLLEDQDGQKYTWDIDNRIATIEPSDGSDEITHRYDAFSRRVYREFGNTDEVLLWWGQEEYAEHENIGSQPTIQNDLHVHPTGLNTTFGRALEGSKHAIQYFHKNYLDHVYAVSDDRGDIIEHYRYTAFGEPEFYNESGEQLAGSAIDNDILWNVKRYSEASELYMYLYRHYEAEHGRWSSRDPITEEGGVNLYVFVENKPVMRLDYLGLLEGDDLADGGSFFAQVPIAIAAYLYVRGEFSRKLLNRWYTGGGKEWKLKESQVKKYINLRKYVNPLTNVSADNPRGWYSGNKVQTESQLAFIRKLVEERDKIKNFTDTSSFNVKVDRLALDMQNLKGGLQTYTQKFDLKVTVGCYHKGNLSSDLPEEAVDMLTGRKFWVASGTVEIFDRWDFNSDAYRESDSNVMVWFMSRSGGKPFDITSEPINVRFVGDPDQLGSESFIVE